MIKILKLQNLDKVTQFRVLNAFFVAISLSILAPVAIVLKGLYMLPWLISLFSIAYMLAVKTNKYLVPLGNEKLYKIGILLHILLICTTSVYFFNPHIMILMDAILLFFITANFSAYSISLTNYIVKYHSESVPEFQLVKNNIWADGSMIGLMIATITLLISMNLTIITFIVYNTLFSLFMIYNWNFFRD